MTQYDPNAAASVTATARQILIPMIRQVYPTMLANQILGVQPMSIGTGHMFTTKFKMAPQSKYKFSRAKWYVAEYDWIDYAEVVAWCKEQFGPHPRQPDAWSRWWDRYEGTVHFRDEKDYNWFLLRWS